MSARPQVCAPRVFAPTQRAPSPAWPVTPASPWHPTGSHVKVRRSGWFHCSHWNFTRAAQSLSQSSVPAHYIKNKSLLSDVDDAWLFWHVHCGLEALHPYDKTWAKIWDPVIYSWCECVMPMTSALCVNTDVNECEDTGLCHRGQCTNTVGSYSCSCPTGLELVDGTSCRGIYTHTYTHTYALWIIWHIKYNISG